MVNTRFCVLRLDFIAHSAAGLILRSRPPLLGPTDPLLVRVVVEPRATGQIRIREPV